MYTYCEAKQHRVIARRAKLSGRSQMANIVRVVNLCNGIGADWMPCWLCWLIGRVCPWLLVVADIHDLRYDSGGSEVDKCAADGEFLVNGYRMAEYCYPRNGGWRNAVMRWIVRWCTRRMVNLLLVGGGMAWRYK